MLALPNCRSFLNLHPPASAKTTRSRARSSMEPSASRPAVAGFPYLLPAHRELMMDLISSIEARLGPTALLPSSVPADVLYFENQAGTSQGALDIRSGAPDSSVDFILESWLHCKVPSGDLNITTVLGFLNASTDAPHLMMDVIQGSPTSLILLMDLLPRRDPVLHPEYLEFYESTHLDKLRRDLEQLPQVSPYRSPSLYIRSILSPTAIAVSIDCGSEGEGCMEETLGVHISRAAKGIVEVWMDKCAEGGSIDLEEGTRAEMLKRDELIKSKAVEIDLAANLPRLFGPDIANKIVVRLQSYTELRSREREKVANKRENEKRERRKRERMSWQTYVDEHLLCDIDGQHLTAAAIIGNDGSVWAQSENFPQYKPEEITAIMKDFAEPGSLAPTGLFLGGVKYMVIQGEPGAVIRGKKGSGGITVKKTNLAVIFGIYDEPMTPGQCNMVVERLGDYLIEQGF